MSDLNETAGNEENIVDKSKLLRKRILIGLSVLVAVILYCFWQNNLLKERYYTFESDKVSADAEMLKVALVSDLHNKSFGGDGKRLTMKLKEYSPDLIAITGDLVDSNHTDVDTALGFVCQAVEIAPVYFVTGNHEKWLETSVYDSLMAELEELGVVILSDEAVVFEHGGEKYNIIGLDDNSLSGDALSKIVKDVDMSLFTILLAHEPQYFDSYCEAGVDVALTGHAHGGQFVLPFVGGLYAPGQGFNPEYYEGCHTKDNTAMIISRGLGNSVIPLRMSNFPELVYVEICANE